MSKYDDLIKIIDTFRNEAPAEHKRYHPDAENMSGIENARSRAFIHLFLKVKFGLTEFKQREELITDDPGDGGIDAYFIDKENKKLFFIQSKFRNTDKNFENKEIAMEDLLAMDIQRIVEGEEENEAGERYNGKILHFIKSLQEISDLPKYEYNIILLANLKSKIEPKLKKLTGGYAVQIYNHAKVYSELVFPLISGSYYNPKEVKITINVDRDSAGHRIQYYPSTQYGNCTVNALFVPTIEIARILSKYKNAILKFNPRSYLNLASGSVNAQIASSIIDFQTNEFALFNNGITMLSDETIYSDKVGKKNKAEILVTNPQIINGGQTAYTLSILYDRFTANGRLDLFEGKEVLLKIISFNTEENEEDSADKLRLIEKISIATNQQSPVSEADRRANDKVQIELQRLIYQDFGLFYERKRGEFGDGIRNGYIDRKKIIDREQFIRICLTVQNDLIRVRSSNVNNLFKKSKFDTILPDASNYRRLIYAYKAFENINKYNSPSSNVRTYARFAITCVLSHRFKEELKVDEFDASIHQELSDIIGKWSDFEQTIRNDNTNKKFYFKEIFDKNTGVKTIETNWPAYYKGRTLLRDIKAYFKI